MRARRRSVEKKVTYVAEHYFTSRPRAASRPGEIEAELRGIPFTLTTDAAVFSGGRVDKGTRLLIDALPLPATGDALDLGCGYGPIGLAIAAVSPDVTVSLVDINERATALAASNARRHGLANVRVYTGNGFEPVEGERFALIASNPPIRAGKRVIYPWVERAYEHLLSDGQLFVVVRTRQGAKSLARKIEEVFGRCDEMSKGSGYRVLAATRTT